MPNITSGIKHIKRDLFVPYTEVLFSMVLTVCFRVIIAGKGRVVVSWLASTHGRRCLTGTAQTVVVVVFNLVS